MFWNKSKLNHELCTTPIIYNSEFTAEEAYEESLAASENKRQNELNKAFKRIKEEVEQGCTNCNFLDEGRYDLDLLNRELAKLGYEVIYHDGFSPWLHVSWDRAKPEEGNIGIKDSGHNINPDKSYILPMEGTETWSESHLYAYRVKDQWAVVWAPDDDYAISCENIVKGADILNGPDWVKAIKPVEVKE